jgi:N-acetylglucosamine malate deacetylase 1
MPAVLAIAAHPDDIEYVMAGTLLLLKEKGWDIHYWNLSSGNGGSLTMDGPTTAATRIAEGQAAAALLGATFYQPIAQDLEIIYSVPLLRQVAAVVRRVNPSILLTHSPEDYMEDHQNTSRLATTAAFAKNVPNFHSDPVQPGAAGDVTVYHAMPHGLRTPLRHRVTADAWANTERVQVMKQAALSAHQSQQSWLQSSQGMNSYVQAMVDFSLVNGRDSGRYIHAEGWRRHYHVGFSATDHDPLAQVLGEDWHLNPASLAAPSVL